jgi:hypothetical protein
MQWTFEEWDTVVQQGDVRGVISAESAMCIRALRSRDSFTNAMLCADLFVLVSPGLQLESTPPGVAAQHV